ncbi:MAG TPA: hypothetical protein VK893_00035, partial [Pyrinomonadaceae bacterium]|nr:hypothetical protein [Pyrinomonadaceae bacterium]
PNLVNSVHPVKTFEAKAVMTNILKLWASTIATTLANPGALLVFAIIYAFLLVASYIFISIREATISQVLVTYLLMILIPIGFFTLQASIVNRVWDQKFRWRVILIDALKFLAVTILVLLLAWLLYYLLNKISARYPAPVVEAPPVAKAAPSTTPALHWPSLFFATLRFVLLGVALPLAAIHLWIAVAGGQFRSLFRQGAKSFFKRIGSALARAFSSDSVLIYGLGLIIFFVLPYAILAPTFTISCNKTEFAVFGLRLLLAFLFSLVGWVSTLTALARAVPALPTTEVSTANVALPTESAA